MIEVTYEVYRFRKWWKSIDKRRRYNSEEEFNIDKRSINLAFILWRELEKEDLWKIRNLKYKYISDEKQ